MMKRLILLAALISCGCTTYKPVDTEPQGAKVYIDGALIGKSPVTVPLKGDYVNLKLELDGYVTELKTIQRIMEYEPFSGVMTSRWPDTLFYRLIPKDKPSKKEGSKGE